MDVLFRCGHAQPVNPDKTPSPVCVECGERVIARVLNARAPRFTGTVTGPYADTKKLDPMPVNLAEKGPLVLKPDPMTAQKDERRDAR